jgi:phosphopantetheinyl transferase
VALYHQNDLPEGGRLAIWHVTENQDELNVMLREQAPDFSESPPEHRKGRIAEWYAVRLLIALLGYDPRIEYNELGKPHFVSIDDNISISHSGMYVSVIIDKKNRVGIDIEETGDRILKVKDKFIGTSESIYLDGYMQPEILYVIWGAKECAFKIYGKGSVDFRKNLIVHPFKFSTKGTTQVNLEKPAENEQYHVNWEYFGNLMLVYAIEN